MDQNTSILIIGAGTFGLSTAYHLAKEGGYGKITVLEKSSSIPPDLSAANDLNKIVRAEYEDPFYTGLALEAIREWQTSDLFAPYFHQRGYLLCTSPAAPEKTRRTLAKSLASISSHPCFRDQIKPIESRDDIQRVAPVFDGPMAWSGYFNRLAGYAHSADALRAIHKACLSLGVDVQLGIEVKSLLMSGNGSLCIGVKTDGGREYRADRTVLALGASLPGVLPSAGKQMSAKAWSVGHIELTAEEAASLRGIPVTYARDLGFFFEPDPATKLLKICPAGGGYTNFKCLESSGPNVSIPVADNAWIPAQDEAKIRRLLRDTLPGLADRSIVLAKLCWCMDTADSEYVIDSVPGLKNLVIAGGDSAHAFKMLPIMGRWVRELLERGGLQTEERWRWKEGENSTADISWRTGETMDLKDVRLAKAVL